MAGRSDPIPDEAAEWLAEESVAGAAPRKSFPAGRSETRVAAQPAFVLHSYPYRETSLIIDVFTPDYGRMALVAKGAKRPHSALRAVLQTFQPLSLSWSGRGDVRTLTRAEWVGGMLPLGGEGLLSGFYLNELLVKFVAREDGHPVLFAHYVETLNKLAHGEPAAFTLRAFERVLLRETGFAAQLDRCIDGEPVQADAEYVYHPERGIRRTLQSDPSSWPVLRGQTLIDMERDDYASRPTTAQQSRSLMRFLLHYHLHGTPLSTRQILIDLQKL
ncbi:DNA repair protein RecO [Ralstonia sp. VS2407]